MNDLVLKSTRPRAAGPSQSGAQSTPLGTAGWLEFASNAKFDFQLGQFWLGRLPGNQPVGYGDDRHVLVTCGTRIGKGRSVIIPNLCTWPGSVVVLDPKGENAMVTARRRGNGSAYCTGMRQTVRILDPFGAVGTSRDSFSDLKVGFNPMDAIRVDSPESVDEAGRIADALVVVENSREPFWEESGKALLRALILHVASWKEIAPAARNLITVRAMLMRGDAETRRLLAMNLADDEAPSGLALLFDNMKRNPAFGGVVANAGERYAAMLAREARLMGSIIQVAATNTDFLDSPAMQACLSRSDFALSELKTNPKGTSLYLCLPQRYMESHYRWLRMMVTLITTEMERVKQRPASGHPVLMVLDEFPALRRMRVLENAAAQIAGSGVKMMFVVQTFPQLKDLYQDNWETFVANCGVKLFFGNDDNFTREYVSRLAGECEVVRLTQTQGKSEGRTNSKATTVTKGVTDSRALGSSVGSQGGTSVSDTSNFGNSASTATATTTGTNSTTNENLSETLHKRPLITPDEVGRQFGNPANPAMLALISGLQPLRLKRIFYDRDYSFEGVFDFHPHHPPPLTVAQVLERRRKASLDEQRRREEMIRQRHAESVKQGERMDLHERRVAAIAAAHAELTKEETARNERRATLRNTTVQLASVLAASIPMSLTFGGIAMRVALAVAAIGYAQHWLRVKLPFKYKWTIKEFDARFNKLLAEGHR